MNDEALREEATVFLRENGCLAVRVDGGGDNWFVSCGYKPGEFFVTAYSARCPTTPNDPLYLARQALAALLRNEGPSPCARDGRDSFPEELHPTPPTYGEATNSEIGAELEQEAPTFDDGESVALALIGGSEIDAEFSESEAQLALAGIIGDAGDVIEGGDIGEMLAIEEALQDFVPDPSPEPDVGGVAYFGDNLQVIRLAKIGRVTQIALTLKAVLQEGWGWQEFSSLQNLVVRIEQGLIPDEPVQRARFMALSDASIAMRQVDMHAGAQVEFLNATAVEGVESFDPEAGWP